MVSICISQMTKDVEHFLMFLLAICMHSFVEFLFKCSLFFFIGLSFYYRLFMFSIQYFVRYKFFNVFLNTSFKVSKVFSIFLYKCYIIHLELIFMYGMR